MNCREIQERLAESGKVADPRVKEHIENCPECKKVLEGLEAVDAALAELPGVTPPKDVVQRTITAVDRRKAKPHSTLRLALAIGSPIVLVLVVGIIGTTFMMKGEQERAPAIIGTADIPNRLVEMTDVGDTYGGHAYWVGDRTEVTRGSGRMTVSTTPDGAKISGAIGGLDADPQHYEDGKHRRGHPDTGSIRALLEGAERVTEEENEETALRWKADELRRRGDLAQAEAYYQKVEKLDKKVKDLKDRVSRTKSRLELLKESTLGPEKAGRKPAKESPGKGLFDYEDETAFSSVRGKEKPATKKPEVSRNNVTTEIDEMDKDARDLQRQLNKRDPRAAQEAQKLTEDISKLKQEGERLKNERGWSGEDSGLRGGDKPADLLVVDDSGSYREQAGEGFLKIETIPWADVYVDGKAVKGKEVKEIKLPPGDHRIVLSRDGYKPVEKRVKIQGGKTTQIRTALVEEDLDQLAFIPAQGYFKNTYLPGDPELAFLKEKLSKGLFMDGEVLRLERASVPYVQPFDAPSASGLAVYLSADKPAIEGKSRVTLQVGLKGSQRHARRRAALNAALVVDLRTVPSEEDRRALWALADSMAGSLQAGDRFHLVVAGVKKPLKVEPASFKMTTVRSALASALEEIEGSGVEWDLQPALDTAYKVVGGDGADDAPIGANLVLLASAGHIGEDIDALQLGVHSRAVNGITLSTIGVGQLADTRNLGALALAGQGRRRLVAGPKAAGPVVEEELAASGSVVARAVRLRIRLAKDVKLVEVLGSQPLTVERTKRVREMEQAIDKKVAKNLGIAADRGEDEDGIQIVIPAYYAGDDHVVLLDVVVPGPGKVADVRVRYKDLVNLNNAVARAEMTLKAGQRPDDLLVRNVRKNLLAYRVSSDLHQAAESLQEGRFDAARDMLAGASARIEQMRDRYPELADDPEIARDAGMLVEYLQVLGDYPMWQGNRNVQVHLVRSLAYAAKVKLPPGQSH